MKQITASKFKEQCLTLIDEVGPEGILITKRGKPVAKLMPAKSDFAKFIGSMKGKVKIHGDIFSTGLKWEAES